MQEKEKERAPQERAQETASRLQEVHRGGRPLKGEMTGAVRTQKWKETRKNTMHSSVSSAAR